MEDVQLKRGVATTFGVVKSLPCLHFKIFVLCAVTLVCTHFWNIRDIILIGNDNVMLLS